MIRLLPGALLAITVVLLLTGCCTAPKAGDRQADLRPLLLNITEDADDAHEQTMALQLAGHALDQGRPVVLFYNVEAVSVPTKQYDPALKHGDTPIKQLLARCIERGAQVLVCPHCMKVESVNQADLVDGASVAAADSLFGVVDQNAAVFSY